MIYYKHCSKKRALSQGKNEKKRKVYRRGMVLINGVGS